MSDCNPSTCELLKLKQDFGLVPADVGLYRQRVIDDNKIRFMRSCFTLIRNNDDNFGRLYYRGVYLCDVLENPDYIFPCGNYPLKWSYSPKFRQFTIEVLDVVGRTGIRFHAGNFVGDSKGCLLLGVRKDSILQYSTITVDRINQIFIECNVDYLIVFENE